MNKITDIGQLDLNGTYTYANYLTWRFEERVELIWGKVFRLFQHLPCDIKRYPSALLRGLFAHFEKHTCTVFHAPFDVRLVDQKKARKPTRIFLPWYNPDICVICDESKLDDKGCLGALDWIIEILSPGTAKKTSRSNTTCTKKTE
ncbi:MAG: Uma2 family endonuclease [Lewinellaceae bacterium]|nr:Uma2 family endonuclease [Lewinellaceae bacterium]